MASALERAARAVNNAEAQWSLEPTGTRSEMIARAVLMAVRVPPSEIAEAGYQITGYEENCDVSFTAIIDAILNEKDTTND